jgi:hypothetical protein
MKPLPSMWWWSATSPCWLNKLRHVNIHLTNSLRFRGSQLRTAAIEAAVKMSDANWATASWRWCYSHCPRFGSRPTRRHNRLWPSFLQFEPLPNIIRMMKPRSKRRAGMRLESFGKKTWSK